MRYRGGAPGLRRWGTEALNRFDAMWRWPWWIHRAGGGTCARSVRDQAAVLRLPRSATGLRQRIGHIARVGGGRVRDRFCGGIVVFALGLHPAPADYLSRRVQACAGHVLEFDANGPRCRGPSSAGRAAGVAAGIRRGCGRAAQTHRAGGGRAACGRRAAGGVFVRRAGFEHCGRVFGASGRRAGADV